MDESEYSDPSLPSKSELKREADALQQAGLKLMDMKSAQLARLPLSDALKNAIRESRRISSHEARRRHAQYVGRLMREANGDAILAAMAELQNPLRQKRLQDWLDRVCTCEQARDTGALVQEMLEWYPHGERQHLANLCRNLVAARPENEEDTPAQDRFRRERRKLGDYLNELERSAPL